MKQQTEIENIDFSFIAKRNDEIIKPFEDLVLNVISNGDIKTNDFVWSWMANIIQNPQVKNKTALILQGETKASGKSTFVQIFSQLIKGYYINPIDKKTIFSHSNNHLLNKLCLYYEGDIQVFSKDELKHLEYLITQDKLIYRKKSNQPKVSQNYLNFIIDSNITHERVEEFFTILNISNCKSGNTEFFDNLYKLASQKDFMEALMYKLSTYDITK